MNSHIFVSYTYSFGIETIKTFIHSRSSLKNQSDSRPKWPKFLPVFRPKRRKNHTRWGSTYLYSLYKGVPAPRPPPPRAGQQGRGPFLLPSQKPYNEDCLFPWSGAPNVNFRKISVRLRSRIFGTFFVKFLAWLILLGFPNTLKKWYNCPFLTDIYPKKVI